MIIIPGFIIAFATFPGVIIHEVAHQIFCRWFGLAVFDVCYFDYDGSRIGLGNGFVMHEITDRFGIMFAVSVGPFFVNSIFCMLLCLPALVPMQMFGHTDVFTLFLIWLGVSIGMHAFPSLGDAKGLYTHCCRAARKGNILAICTFPLVGLIFLVNVGRFFWLDLIYGIGIGIGLPYLILTKVLEN